MYILYIENHKVTTRQLLQLENTFSKLKDSKLTHTNQKGSCIQMTNTHKKDIGEIITFTITSENPRIYLTKKT